MVKSVEYKRRLRRNQKTKKLCEFKKKRSKAVLSSQSCGEGLDSVQSDTGNSASAASRPMAQVERPQLCDGSAYVSGAVSQILERRPVYSTLQPEILYPCGDNTGFVYDMNKLNPVEKRKLDEL